MRDKTGTRRRVGQLGGADSDAAAKLACLIGAPTLKYLDDEDMEALALYIKYLVDEAAADAFKAGWTAAAEYNDEHARLHGAGPSTEH